MNGVGNNPLKYQERENRMKNVIAKIKLRFFEKDALCRALDLLDQVDVSIMTKADINWLKDNRKKYGYDLATAKEALFQENLNKINNSKILIAQELLRRKVVFW
jgi:hypothetical protein